MSTVVVLAVGLDSSLGTTQGSVWQSAGYVIKLVSSIREAIDYFRSGDFDLVLLGPSLSLEQKERLAFLVRRCGTRTPIVCIAEAPCCCGSFADASLSGNFAALMTGMGEVMAKRATLRVV